MLIQLALEFELADLMMLSTNMFMKFNSKYYNIRQMLKNQANRHHFQSTKSLSKFKMEGTNKASQLVPLLRVKQQGNSYSITTNVANYSSNKQGNKMEDNYIKRIKYLQTQFKKRLIDDTVLRNLFKVKIPSQITHLDIYLEIRKLEQTVKTQLEVQKQLKNKVSQLQNLVQKQEQQHLRYIEMLGESIEEKQMQWKSQKLRLQDKNTSLLESSQNCKYLVQQIKKKYENLNKRYKDVSDELEIQKSAKNLQILQEKEQFQNRSSQYIQEIQIYKSEIKNLRKQVQDLKNQNQNEEAQHYQLLSQFQQTKDEKQKLELRIREIQQISNDYSKQNKMQKQKYTQQLQKISLENKSQLQLIKNQHEQQIKQLELKSDEFKFKLQETQKLLATSEAKLTLLSQQKCKMQTVNQELIQKQKILQKQLANIQKKNVKLSIQLMQIRCEKDEQYKAFAKQRLQMQDKQNILRNLQSKRIMSTTSKNAQQLKSQIHKKYFRS